MPATSTTPVVRLAELEIDPDQFDAYKRLLREEVEASITLEPGVLALHAVTPRDGPATVRLLEIYRDQPSYEAHLLSPHFLKYKTLTAGMVRSLRLIEADPVILGAKPSG